MLHLLDGICQNVTFGPCREFCDRHVFNDTHTTSRWAADMYTGATGFLSPAESLHHIFNSQAHIFSPTHVGSQQTNLKTQENQSFSLSPSSLSAMIYGLWTNEPIYSDF